MLDVLTVADGEELVLVAEALLDMLFPDEILYTESTPLFEVAGFNEFFR